MNQMLPSDPTVIPFMLAPMMPPFVAPGTGYWLKTPAGVSSPIAFGPSSVHQSVPSLAVVIWSGPWPVSVPDESIGYRIVRPGRRHLADGALRRLGERQLAVGAEGDAVEPVLEEAPADGRRQGQLGDHARRGDLADRVIQRVGEIDVAVRPAGDPERGRCPRDGVPTVIGYSVMPVKSKRASMTSMRGFEHRPAARAEALECRLLRSHRVKRRASKLIRINSMLQCRKSSVFPLLRGPIRARRFQSPYW